MLDTHVDRLNKLVDEFQSIAIESNQIENAYENGNATGEDYERVLDELQEKKIELLKAIGAYVS